ncbi:hypothetical protein BDZ90DRAFT_232168 [Jaminaea rosea]|uniref:Myb-like domain-containing protein n=1 Tax=Jaminaea rosea TaxID=1569628 RepID=A0A316UR41_9BASI|nr:hypothetical protein BDZ90DRAFT_232168 [Jaminaea rosea]PWN27779.1 hypothetical protein BDZ90DRAFT_232168 [Jaminaea rosea]
MTLSSAELAQDSKGGGQAMRAAGGQQLVVSQPLNNGTQTAKLTKQSSSDNDGGSFKDQERGVLDQRFINAPTGMINQQSLSTPSTTLAGPPPTGARVVGSSILWTRQDDFKLISAVNKWGHHWTAVRDELGCAPGSFPRTVKAIEHRYARLVQEGVVESVMAARASSSSSSSLSSSASRAAPRPAAYSKQTPSTAPPPPRQASLKAGLAKSSASASKQSLTTLTTAKTARRQPQAWTEQETAVVRQLQRKHPGDSTALVDAFVATFPGTTRSKSSIQNKAWDMNRGKTKDRAVGKKYKGEEDDDDDGEEDSESEENDDSEEEEEQETDAEHNGVKQSQMPSGPDCTNSLQQQLPVNLDTSIHYEPSGVRIQHPPWGFHFSVYSPTHVNISRAKSQQQAAFAIEVTGEGSILAHNLPVGTRSTLTIVPIELDGLSEADQGGGRGTAVETSFIGPDGFTVRFVSRTAGRGEGAWRRG